MSLRAAALAALLLVGCKTTPKAGPVATDAGGSDAAFGSAVEAGPPKERDRTIVAVGVGTSDVRLLPTLDGRIVLAAGSLLYEGKASGALAPLAPPAAFAPLYPDDDTFVGFLQPSMGVLWIRGELGAPGPLFLDGSMGKRKTFAFRDGKVTPASTIEVRHVVRWRGKLIGANTEAKANELAWLEDKSEPAPAAPAKISAVTELFVDARGALVAFGGGPYEMQRAAIYPATWKPGDAPTVVEGPTVPSCYPVPAFDGSAVVRCAESMTDGVKFFRISAAGFERVFPDAPAHVSAASIGNDGALYVSSTKRLAVERCPAPTGKCTTIAVNGIVRPVQTASYEPYESDVVERKGDDIGSRNWTTIKVDAPSEKETFTGSYSILARAEDDVWILAHAGRRTVVLHSTDDPQREPARLPSRLDGRLMIKNESPPQPWTAHCEQIFVRLGSTDADGSAKRVPEIEKALGSAADSYESAFRWSLVEGRLHEGHAVGVVVVHRDVEEPLDKMERAIDRLVTAFSPNPMNKPSAYCTLPVLERRLHPSGT